MRFYTKEEAKEKGLIQLITWVRDIKSERDFIERATKQVLINPGRKAMPVKNGGLIALYVDEVGIAK